VTGRDLEGIAAHDVHGGAVGHLDAQTPRYHVADVVNLAAFGANDRLDVLGPTPAWLEHGASDGQLSQLDQLDAGLLDRPNFVGTVEALAAQLHGTDRTSGLIPRSRGFRQRKETFGDQIPQLG
jgi:hypothetical protein